MISFICTVEQTRVVQSVIRSDGASKREVLMRSLLLWKLCGIWLSKQHRGRVYQLHNDYIA